MVEGLFSFSPLLSFRLVEVDLATVGTGALATSESLDVFLFPLVFKGSEGGTMAAAIIVSPSGTPFSSDFLECNLNPSSSKMQSKYICK